MADARSPEKVDIRIECNGWGEIDCAALSAKCYAAVEAAFADVGWPVSILFTDNASIQALNRTFRDKNKPTNVLSFPPGDAVTPEHDYLGDIAIAFETCREEAVKESVSLADHTAHLLIHGLLHLMGYDHQTDEEAAEMERFEAELLATLEIADPYREKETVL